MLPHKTVPFAPKGRMSVEGMLSLRELWAPKSSFLWCQEPVLCNIRLKIEVWPFLPFSPSVIKNPASLLNTASAEEGLCVKTFVQSEKLLPICGANECETLWSPCLIVDPCSVWSWVCSGNRLWNVITETYFPSIKDLFKAFLSGLIILLKSSLYHSGGLKYFPFSCG